MTCSSSFINFFEQLEQAFLATTTLCTLRSPGSLASLSATGAQSLNHRPLEKKNQELAIYRQLLSEKEIASARLEELLNQRESPDNYKYPRPVVRDFNAMCVFDLGLEITPELQQPMLNFFEQLGMEPDASAEDCDARIRAYFAAHPMDPRLAGELGSLGRDVLLGRVEGFKSTIEAMRAPISIGAQLAMHAPSDGSSQPKARPEKGLE